MFLVSSLTRRKACTVGPQLKVSTDTSIMQQQKKQHSVNNKTKLTIITNTSSFPGFFQKQVSLIQSRKSYWMQQISPFKQKQEDSAAVVAPVDLISEKQQLASSIAPTPPPKKSTTMPNISTMADRTLLEHRALPSLPSSVSRLRESGSSGLTRASTWVGKSIQKWLTATEVALDSQDIKEEEEKEKEEIETFATINSIDTINTLSKKMKLHCRILQVTNLASSKSYEYTMQIRVTNNPTQTHCGEMKRVARGISAAHPRAALSFNIQGQFQLECELSIKPIVSSSILIDSFRMLRSKTANISLLSSSNHNLTTVTSPTESVEEFNNDVIEGRLELDSGQDLLNSFANKGIGRYSIQTTTGYPLLQQRATAALELTLAFWLEEDKDEVDMSQVKKEEDVSSCNTSIDEDVQRYCQAGDYLTFYVRSEFYPMWARYWVTFKNNQLVLRLNERGEEAVDSISLKELVQVDISPSDDIQEEIYLGKKHSIVLRFGKLDMYLFADNSTSVRFWKYLLEQRKGSSSYCNSKSMMIHKKFLWPVAQ